MMRRTDVQNPKSEHRARTNMMDYAKLPTWADADHVHAVIETPRGSQAKLEFDTELGVFTLSKPLLARLTYPYDWGFIRVPRRTTAIRSM
jgi:hypothetical protein